MNKKSDYSILFVDDEEKALKYFTKAYSEYFSIITCSNTADAKEILDQNSEKISVLITDQRMPNEKGIELLKYTRQRYPHITRLLTTAYSDLDDAIEAVNSGEILRYVTKPWDIQNLYTDLCNAMQFFTLRHERDQLLREKLNIKQRLVGLNRARDLVIMASGFTHLRNSIQAIASLLLQLPTINQSNSINLENIGGWGLLEYEIKEQIDITNKLIKETRSDNKFQTGSIMDTIQNALKENLDSINLTIDKLPSIKFNEVLLTSMLKGLLEVFTKFNVSDKKIQISAKTVSADVIITFSIDNSELDKSSLLEIPINLISAFLICYHHSGSIEIDFSSGFSCNINLPPDPEITELPMLDDDWLDQVFRRFESWAD